MDAGNVAPFDEMSVELDSRDLQEIIEIASQITAQLDVDAVIRYVVWSFYAKVRIDSVTFALAADPDEEDVKVTHYQGSNIVDFPMDIPALVRLIRQFDQEEYNQISFAGFREHCRDPLILETFERLRTDFIALIRTDKGVVGFVLLPGKADGGSYTLQEIQYFIRIIRFASIAIENADLYWQATTDRMTRLFSHHFFEKSLTDELNRARRFNSSFALIMLDIDHFKSINDTYGHLQGDLIIKEISRLLLGSVRNIDFCARYGGEEFAILLPEVDVDGAAVVAERIRSRVEQHSFPGNGEALHITVSVGVSAFHPQRIHSPSELVAEADRALYESKERGRNRITIRR